MNNLEDPLNRLIAAARERRAGPPALAAPPWFARSVAHRWLAAQEAAPARSWHRISRGALVCAVLIMAVSLACNLRLVRHRNAPELIASESVVSLFLPK